jgi:hypothetical protein
MNSIEKEAVKGLWASLGDVPVNDDGEIQIPWGGWQAGTDREEIWHWFEETFEIPVHALMYPSEHPEIWSE